MHFLQNDTKAWSNHNGSFVAYGLLCAVFDVLFKLTNKNNVIEVILMALTNHIKQSDFNNIMKHLNSLNNKMEVN